MGTIPTITTFTAGQELTAAELNNMKDVSDFWALTPRCSCYQGSAQTLSTATGTAINMDTEIYDIVQSGDTASHDTSTNNTRLYCRTAGKYEVAGQVQFNSNATGVRVAMIRLNAAGSYSGGTALVQNTQGALSGGSTSAACIPTEVELAVGDYIELFGYQTSGGNLALATGQANTFVRMKLTGS